MIKHLISFITFFCLFVILSPAQDIDLDWKNDFVANKKKIFVDGKQSATEGIVINAVPAGTDKNKIEFKVNGSIASKATQPTGPDQVYYDNLGTSLNNALAVAPEVELILLLNGTEIGKVTLSKRVSGATTPPVTGKATARDFQDAVKKAYGLKIQSGTIKYDSRLNQSREKNIIHVFVDEQMNFHYSSIPTTAREDNLFVFHLFYEKKQNVSYRLEYEGQFDPAFEVFGTETQPKDITRPNATGEEETVQISEQTFGAIGPFTGSFKVKIMQVGSTKVILEKAVKVAKLHHITLTAGLYGTFLRNPNNISTFQKPNGDTTLVADDPTSRGFITIMLTFYPRPRNILFPSKDWKERIGFCIGTSISKKLAENFFGGISYDIARGLALTGGVHYGRVAYVIDYVDFKFGEDKFSGNLENRVKKKWDIGFHVGINMDFRLLTYIFNPQQQN